MNHISVCIPQHWTVDRPAVGAVARVHHDGRVDFAIADQWRAPVGASLNTRTNQVMKLLRNYLVNGFTIVSRPSTSNPSCMSSE